MKKRLDKIICQFYKTSRLSRNPRFSEKIVFIERNQEGGGRGREREGERFGGFRIKMLKVSLLT